MPSPDVSTIADRLSQTTFLDLFQRLDRKLLESLWDDGHASEALQTIVQNTTLSPYIRFLGAEILFTMDPAYPPNEARESLAAVYAVALRLAPKEMANPWGLPGLNHAQVADHVLRLGDAAISALLPLLDDVTPVQFSGSKEATYGNSFAWRIKDIAASLVARIRSLPFDPDSDPSTRDSTILQLKATLETSR